MTALKTRDSLLKKMSVAAKATPTEAQLRKQRVSFIMGSLKGSSSVTRARVEEVLAAHEGKKSA